MKFLIDSNKIVNSQGNVVAIESNSFWISQLEDSSYSELKKKHYAKIIEANSDNSGEELVKKLIPGNLVIIEEKDQKEFSHEFNTEGLFEEVKPRIKYFNKEDLSSYKKEKNVFL